MVPSSTAWRQAIWRWAGAGAGLTWTGHRLGWSAMSAPAPSLSARTQPTPDATANLLALAPGPGAHVWLRRGEGLVAWGEAARLELTGPGRARRAVAWWRQVAGRAAVEDLVQVPGTGLIGFGSFAFDDDSALPSLLIVPRVVAGRRGETAWLTAIEPIGQGAGPRPDASLEPAAAVSDHGPVQLRPGTHTAAAWPGIVRRALTEIQAGRVDKVVLARDEWAEARAPIDPRLLLARLSANYPSCWAYAVDGTLGATPELLVRSVHGLVSSRVLAGTIRRTDDDAANLARAAALARSSKDLEEHEYAVASVARALAAFTDEILVPEVPYVLHLPNVMHLASDVTGVLRPGADRPGPSSLELAAALHPSAAVCGTPTRPARRLIGELEGVDRGRYAGPVGWMGADGDGEWGIALRGAQLSPDRRRARLFAGGGIVGASVPAEELAETEAKLAPMHQALGVAP
jgi:menaquinone-specific isochorismate synthase